jgi:hypothetical protein
MIFSAASDQKVMDMIRVTAREFQKAFGAMSDQAIKEPVAITKQSRDHLVVLSATNRRVLTNHRARRSKIIIYQ